MKALMKTRQWSYSGYFQLEIQLEIEIQLNDT